MDVPRWVRRALLAGGTCELVALTIWIGGLIVIIGSVIPAVFNSFGMEPGGRFLTRVFDGYNRLVIVAVVMLMSVAGFRYWVTGRFGRAGAALSRPEIALLMLMVAVAAGIILILGPASVALQEQAFATKEEAARQAAYAAFFKTHMVVRALYVLNLVLGIGLLVVKLKEWTKL
jgi:hypothetical protein